MKKIITVILTMALLTIIGVLFLNSSSADEHLILKEEQQTRLISPIKGSGKVVLKSQIEEETTTYIYEVEEVPTQVPEEIVINDFDFNFINFQKEEETKEEYYEEITVYEDYQLEEETWIEEYYEEENIEYAEIALMAYSEEETQFFSLLTIDDEDYYYFEEEENALTYSGDWLYDEEENDWEYVEEDYDFSNAPTYSGEWIYNYDTDEWEYFEDNYYEESYEENNDYYEEETYSGEWIYNYDIDEWEYVEENYENNNWVEEDNYYDEDFTDNDYYEEDDWYNEEEDDCYEDDYYEDDYYEDDDNYEYSFGQEIVNYALQWVGVTPYVMPEDRWTGNGYYNSLVDGTDCSGFTHLIYGAFGIYLPTGSDAYQYSVGTSISYDELMPGDIIVYRYGGHVAIYIGNDQIVHCSNPSSGTIVSTMWYTDPTNYIRVVC